MSIYSRKISDHEARRNYLFVSTDHSWIFPREVPFTIKLGNIRFQSRLDAKQCQCLGPKDPHEHLAVPLSPFLGLKKGDQLTLQRSEHDLFIGRLERK